MFSAQGRPVLCQKPVLISTVPSLCPMHFQKAERQVARALKKEGLSFSSPSKLAPKLHVIVTVCPPNPNQKKSCTKGKCI